MTVNSKSRHHHNFKPIEDDLFYQIDRNTYKLFDKQNNSHLLIKQDKIINRLEKTKLDINREKNQFTYERDLQNFLSKNLTLIEPKLKLFQDDNINGIEYPVGGLYIDILALDKNNNYVVIELKVSQGYDKVIGQLLRYMAWIKKHKAKNNQIVRGIIIAKEISNDLLLACEELPNIELFEYQLSVILNKKK